MAITLYPCVLVFRSQANPSQAIIDRSGLIGFCPVLNSVCLVSAGVPQIYEPFKLTGQSRPARSTEDLALQLAERGIILNESPASPGAFASVDFTADHHQNSNGSRSFSVKDPEEDTFEGKINAMHARGQVVEDFESINLSLANMRLH